MAIRNSGASKTARSSANRLRRIPVATATWSTATWWPKISLSNSRSKWKAAAAAAFNTAAKPVYRGSPTFAANVTANVGPVNLNWMLTGPQADFWPSAQILDRPVLFRKHPDAHSSWRGQVVEGPGFAKKQLMGNIGDIDATRQTGENKTTGTNTSSSPAAAR